MTWSKFWIAQHWSSHLIPDTYFFKYISVVPTLLFNSLRPRHNGRHFPDDIFKWIFVNENVWILIKLSLKFVSKGLINHIPALVQIMAWRRPGDKRLSEPMMVSLLTHIYMRHSASMISFSKWHEIRRDHVTHFEQVQYSDAGIYCIVRNSGRYFSM